MPPLSFLSLPCGPWGCGEGREKIVRLGRWPRTGAQAPYSKRPPKTPKLKTDKALIRDLEDKRQSATITHKVYSPAP